MTSYRKRPPTAVRPRRTSCKRSCRQRIAPRRYNDVCRHYPPANKYLTPAPTLAHPSLSTPAGSCRGGTGWATFGTASRAWSTPTTFCASTPECLDRSVSACVCAWCVCVCFVFTISYLVSCVSTFTQSVCEYSFFLYRSFPSPYPLASSSNPQLLRAACLIRSCVQFHLTVLRGELPVEYSGVGKNR